MKKKILSLLGVLGFLIFSSCNNEASKQDESGKRDVKNKPTVENLPLEWTKDANIYEVNIRQYTEEGTFNAFAKQLPRLKNMGVDILWFMPIHPIGKENGKGSLGSYYSISDYKAVNPEFGNLEDFKNLVKLAHENDMHVLIDWVANHTAWDHHWMKTNPEFYELNEKGEMFSPYDWSDVVSLEYNNKEMRAEMIDALEYWVREADIDGYRCDVASEVPTDFWVEARKQIEKIKPVFMLAESEESDILDYAFDMNYGWEFHHLMNGIAKGEKGKNKILEYFKKEKENTPERAYKMYFITNHDENSWNGTIDERLGDAADAMAVMTFTLHGMPLIYSGQEAANAKRLEFFEKDVIEWKGYSKVRFYSMLIAMKHKYQALWNGAYGGALNVIETDNDKVFCYSRKGEDAEVFVMINLSGEDVKVVPTENSITDLRSRMKDNVKVNKATKTFEMGPWGYTIMVKEDTAE